MARAIIARLIAVAAEAGLGPHQAAFRYSGPIAATIGMFHDLILRESGVAELSHGLNGNGHRWIGDVAGVPAEFAVEKEWAPGEFQAAWQTGHQDPRAEMLCAAAEETLLIHISTARDSWLPVLRELATSALITFYRERRDMPHDREELPLHVGLSALDDETEWHSETAPELTLGFVLTDKGFRAREQRAYHFVDGQFVPLRDEDM